MIARASQVLTFFLIEQVNYFFFKLARFFFFCITSQEVMHHVSAAYTAGTPLYTQSQTSTFQHKLHLIPFCINLLYCVPILFQAVT